MIVECKSCAAQNRLPASRLRDRAKCAACKTQLLPISHPIAITSTQDFDELVREAKLPVLIDFWAAWCGPCRMVAPELEKIALSHQDKLLIGKVDTDAQPELSARYRIQSIPTLMLFRDGREADRMEGAMPARAILQRIGM